MIWYFEKLSYITAKTPIKSGFSVGASILCNPFGGEGEIRTLEPLLTVTRFPIVRARPATRLLRVKTVFTFNSIELYHIAREKSSTISFFLENIKIPRRAGGVRRDALPVRRWRRVRKRDCARRIPSRRGAKIVRFRARQNEFRCFNNVN